MKKISKIGCIILLVAGMLMGISSPAVAAGYTIDWMYVQHRVYENGNMINPVSFGILDEAGQRVTDFGDFKDLRLYDPNGNMVSLSNLDIWVEESLRNRT